MFGVLSRSVAAFVASVSGTNSTGTKSSEEPSNASADSAVGSDDGRRSEKSRRASSMKGMNRARHHVERVQANNVDEIVQYLLEQFVSTEVILASLNIEQQEELTVMLSDLVRDCVQCSSTNLIRNPDTNEIDGVCLASKASLFDMQIDRLCEYQFKDDQVATAVEFLKYVFNRLDIAYHFEEYRIFKPIFVALVSVRKEKWGQGLASSMLDSCMNSAKEDKCDGAITLASSDRAYRLDMLQFPITVQSIRYDTFRGRHRDPPIVMPKDEPQRALQVLLRRF